MESIFTRAARFLREQRLGRRWRKIVGVLAALVVFCTTYALILPAMTAERQTICGMEAHEHTEECFENGVQICGKQEHVHTEECYAKGKGITVGVIVGPQGNSVADVPSEPTDGELEVDLSGDGAATPEEGQQPEEEPVPGKTEGELAQELSAVALTGNWGKDAAATAKAHQGCRESGMEMIRQVLSYNQITGIPDASGSYADWVADIRGAGCYKDVSSIPKTGDLVFIDREDNGEPLGREDERIDHAGIVIHVETEKRTIEATGEKVKTLQSIMLLTDNADGLIESYFYSMQDPANVNTIVGYARLPKNPAIAAEEETESQAETQGETTEPAETQTADTASGDGMEEDAGPADTQNTDMAADTDTVTGDGMEEDAGPTETQNADTASGNGTGVQGTDAAPEMTGTEAEAGTDQTEASGTVTEGQTEEETAEPAEDEQKPEGTAAEDQSGEEITGTDIEGHTENKTTEQTAEGQGPADTAADGQTQEAEDKTEPSEVTAPADETKTDTEDAAVTPGTEAETDMEMSTEADTNMSANKDMETEPETTDTEEPETDLIAETPEMETEADTEMSTEADTDMSSNEDMETELETGIEEPGTETITETAGTDTEMSADTDTDMPSIEDKENETDIGDWGWTQEDLENEASTEEWIDDRGWLWTDFAIKDDTGENETESRNPAGKDFENETESWNPIGEDFENETETEWDEWDHLEAETETEAAGSDPEADLETSEDWEASVADTELTGVWADDLTMIAETQLGVKESTENFTFNENGEQKGITRYGQWYGEPYGDWDAMFVSFCLNYAEVPHSSVPRAGSCGTLAGMLQTYGLYEEPAEYEASKGDLVFLDTDADGAADHVGILEEATESGVGGINVIAGDVEDEVKTVVYAKDDAALVGYGRLPQKPAQKMEKKEYRDDSVRIIAEYPAEAGIPENAHLIATEIPQDDERYIEHYETVKKMVDEGLMEPEEETGEEGISTVSNEDEMFEADETEAASEELEAEKELYVRIYNIGFYVDEQEIEPQAEVKISIEFLNDPGFASGANKVVHMEDGKEPEALNVTNTEEEVDGKQMNKIEFSATTFSPYVFVKEEQRKDTEKEKICYEAGKASDLY